MCNQPPSETDNHRAPLNAQDNPSLYSPRFDEHYASAHDPQAEKFVVFCEGNRLPQRFPSVSTFTLVELGFGSALSFLVACRLWLEKSDPHATLDYLSIERYPLTRQTLDNSLKGFPELADLKDELLSHYPSLLRGRHRLNLFDGRVSLTLIFESAQSAMQKLPLATGQRVDAWFLDGFSPAKNPDMWHPAIFRSMRSHSAENATLATYTAAGQVRRDLVAAGFEVHKQPGHGNKRERLTGTVRPGSHAHEQGRRRYRSPWFFPPQAMSSEKSVIVVGAGIGGCALCNRLASRGYRVTLIEQGNTIANATSSNPATVIHPGFTRDNDLVSQLSQQGYLYSLNTFRRLERKNLNSGFHPSGVVLRPKDKDDLIRFSDIANNSKLNAALTDDFAQWLTGEALSAITGLTEKTPAWHFPLAGWLNLPALCKALLREYENNIHIHLDTRVSAIRRDASQRWSLLDEEQNPLASSTAIVFCTGAFPLGIPGAKGLEDIASSLTADGGQIIRVDLPRHGIKLAACGGGYLVPDSADTLFLGASHRQNRVSPTRAPGIEEAETRELIDTFTRRQTTTSPPMPLQAWSGYRATLPDRLPLVGPVMDAHRFSQHYAHMILGKLNPQPHPETDNPSLGMHILSGFGSRGAAYALLCAETLASELATQSGPLSEPLRQALHPVRFYVRQIKKSAASKAS